MISNIRDTPSYNMISYNYNIKKYSYYTTYNKSKAIIKANKAVASEKAKPNIEYENNWFFNEGFLATPIIKHPNTTPIPTPAPAKPIVANPAPINFDDSNIF